MQTLRTTLDSEWQFAERLPAGRDFFLPHGGEKMWLPAQVPGHVHLDLVRNGVIGEPFYRRQERGCAWVDEVDWTYQTVFHVSAERIGARGEHGRHFLHFHGLDTICRVFLNGVKIGEAENFFIPHRFDVTDALREGANELRVEFDSALRVGLERAKAYLGDGNSARGKMSYFNFAPRAFVRKPQYMFGWDWGPELISCGIWQKVELETIPVAEIIDWRYHFEISDQNTARVSLTVEVERYHPHQSLYLMGALHGKELSSDEVAVSEGRGRTRYTLSLNNDRMREWGQTSLSLMLKGTAGWEQMYIPDLFENFLTGVHIRKIELVREPDADGQGECFKFRLNGVDTYIKGANWIPNHSFPALCTGEPLRRQLEQAQEAGFNMLRVWGGGYYETEEFYNLCDELGILVWQDFPFACSSYPDDLPEFREQVRQEAIIAVRRIRNHPCLALWCGGNENLELFQGRWDGDRQATEFFGDRLIHEVLPEVIAAEDPNTPYLPNSPYGDAGEGNSQNENFGDAHYWNVWHAKTPQSSGDWTNYALSRTRFSSEFGFAAPAGLAAWDSCMVLEDKSLNFAARSAAKSKISSVFEYHDKTRKGTEKYLNYIRMHYPDPQTFEDLVYYGQCNQADALQFGVEHWRRLKGRCWGTLFWQLNDCWPTHSWAVVDSMGEPKAAYYAAKRFYAPLLLSLFREGDTVSAHLVNDGLKPVPGVLSLHLLNLDGEERARSESDAIAPANAASGPILSLKAAPSRDAFVHAVFRAPDGTQLAENFQLLAEPKELHLPDPAFAFGVTQEKPGTAEMTISAQRFARYVWLHFTDSPTQPRLTDNFFHLAPGQTRQIAVSDLPYNLTADALRARLRLRWR